MLSLGQAERVAVLAVLQELGRLEQHLDAGGRGLHGGRRAGEAESRALIGCGAPRAADVTSAGKQIQAGNRVLQI